MNAIRARDVARSGDDAALAAADDHRLVLERGIVALLDRGIERVAIHMSDRERVELGMAQNTWALARGAARRFGVEANEALAAKAVH
ncbi:MAG: hypothetical protein U1E87_04775 [Alphaproteobacteria bacterium]